MEQGMTDQETTYAIRKTKKKFPHFVDTTARFVILWGDFVTH